jgi:hypothetical protein
VKSRGTANARIHPPERRSVTTIYYEINVEISSRKQHYQRRQEETGHRQEGVDWDKSEQGATGTSNLINAESTGDLDEACDIMNHLLLSDVRTV